MNDPLRSQLQVASFCFCFLFFKCDTQESFSDLWPLHAATFPMSVLFVLKTQRMCFYRKINNAVKIKTVSKLRTKAPCAPLMSSMFFSSHSAQCSAFVITVWQLGSWSLRQACEGGVNKTSWSMSAWVKMSLTALDLLFILCTVILCIKTWYLPPIH